MKSIFEIENRLNVEKEFKRLMDAICYDREAIIFSRHKDSNRHYGTIFEAIDEVAFLEWKYRDTFLNVIEYFEHIGIDYKNVILGKRYNIGNEAFLFFLEFLVNIFKVFENDERIEFTDRAIAYIQNIPRILEKMNYELAKQEDKIIITKRDADVDSVLENVPKNVANLLLEYNDFRIRNDIEAKKKILKALDLYIENNIKIKEFDSELDNTIGTITNKMGINHPRIEEPYKSYTDEQLLEWYDKCFLMMLHVIRTVEIRKIKKERKDIVNKQ